MRKSFSKKKKISFLFHKTMYALEINYDIEKKG